VALRVVVIGLALTFALFPVVWIISASFNPTGSMSTQTFIPRNVDSVNELFVNYRVLFIGSEAREGISAGGQVQRELSIPFWRWMFNSIIVSSFSTVIVVLTSALSAYAFSRFRFRGRRGLLLTLFLIQVFPNLLAMVSLYLMLDQIGKYIPLFGLNTYGGLILIYAGGGMATNIWLMKGFFDSVPRDIDESALVDGATPWQSFAYLIFPLVRPVLAVVAILTFVGTFNEFLLARIILRSDRELWTLMVGLYSFVSGGEFTSDWGVFAAGSLITAIPIVIVYLSMQRYIVGGLTQGAVKG
jgi:ABC-type maltose transport system permease subunit